MVARDPLARTGNALRRVLCRKIIAPAGTSDPVHRLRRVAEQLRPRGGTAKADRILEGKTLRNPEQPGTAHRPPAAGGEHIPRRSSVIACAKSVGRRVAQFQPTTRRDSIYDPAGRVPDSVVTLLWPGGYRGWLAHCRTQPQGDRGTDWLFR